MRHTAEQWRELAAQGLTAAQAAQRFGVSTKGAEAARRNHGVKFKRAHMGRPAGSYSGKRRDRKAPTHSCPDQRVNAGGKRESAGLLTPTHAAGRTSQILRGEARQLHMITDIRA
jgi:hypothetical protein